MKGFDNLHIKPAVKGLNKMDLDCSTLATMEFGQIVPLFKRALVPRDKFTVGCNFFSRLAPLTTPTYGNFSFRTVAAFVPYHMVAVDAEAYILGKTTFEGYTPLPRYLTIGTLTTFITNGSLTSVGATAQNSVFDYVATDGTLTHNVYTPVGRYYVKVLNALGYALPSGVDFRPGSTWLSSISSKRLNAYPLLSFFKLYNDYMSQSQRFNTSQLSNVLFAIKYGKQYTGIWDNATGQVLPGALSLLFGALLLQYDNDYFTTAWQSANSPLSSVENVTTMPVPSFSYPNLFKTVVNASNDVSLASSNPANYLPQRSLDYLKSFDNWVKRNNYAGSRVVQQAYARMGIKTSDFRDHYAHIITTDRSPIQVGDVTSTAMTAGAPLGDYSGKGIMNNSKSFSYESNDYGMLFLLGYFTVNPMNAYGFDREVLRTEPLDFYTPEFDGLGADAISVGEYYADPLAPANSTADDATFGFTERYNAYRFGKDMILGDFRDYHADGAMNAWHSGRNMSAIRTAGSLVAQNTAVNTLPQIDSEYNRIFANTSGDVDHFYLTCRFKVDAMRPMKTLNQVVGLGEGDLVVPRNGNEIS